RVRFDVPADLVAITTPTPSAPHAYNLAREFRRRGVPVVIGGPHATALPDEAARHVDAVAVGEAEDTWPRILDDARLGKLERVDAAGVSGRHARAALGPYPRTPLREVSDDRHTRMPSHLRLLFDPPSLRSRDASLSSHRRSRSGNRHEPDPCRRVLGRQHRRE